MSTYEMSVCMYTLIIGGPICMYVCMYVCMYAYMYLFVGRRAYVCMYVCMYVYME